MDFHREINCSPLERRPSYLGSVRTDGSAHSFKFLISHRTCRNSEEIVATGLARSTITSEAGSMTCGINIRHPCGRGGVRLLWESSVAAHICILVI